MSNNDYLFEMRDGVLGSLEWRLKHFKVTGEVEEWTGAEVYPGTLLRRVRLVNDANICVEIVKVGRQTPHLRLFSATHEITHSLRNGDEILSMFYPDMRKEVPIPDTPFYAKMRQGHYIRTGHELSGYLTVSGGICSICRTCC